MGLEHIKEMEVKGSARLKVLQDGRFDMERRDGALYVPTGIAEIADDFDSATAGKLLRLMKTGPRYFNQAFGWSYETIESVANGFAHQLEEYAQKSTN